MEFKITNKDELKSAMETLRINKDDKFTKELKKIEKNKTFLNVFSIKKEKENNQHVKDWIEDKQQKCFEFFKCVGLELGFDSITNDGTIASSDYGEDIFFNRDEIGEFAFTLHYVDSYYYSGYTEWGIGSLDKLSEFKKTILESRHYNYKYLLHAQNHKIDAENYDYQIAGRDKVERRKINEWEEI